MQEKVICSKCLYHMPRPKIADLENNAVSQLFWGRVKLKYCTALFFYSKGSIYQNIIHNLKYHGKQYIGVEFGKLFGSELKSTPLSSVDLVVPVPLHQKKTQEKRF